MTKIFFNKIILYILLKWANAEFVTSLKIKICKHLHVSSLFSIQITSHTWSRDSHGLFDYENEKDIT